MFVIFNSTTKQVYTAAEIMDFVVPENHEVLDVQISFADFPAHPAYCKVVDGAIVFDGTISLETETSYIEKRLLEYPSIGDQLDALYHAGVFPVEMAATIQAIKAKYPKPESDTQ